MSHNRISAKHSCTTRWSSGEAVCLDLVVCMLSMCANTHTNMLVIMQISKAWKTQCYIHTLKRTHLCMCTLRRIQMHTLCMREGRSPWGGTREGEWWLPQEEGAHCAQRKFRSPVCAYSVCMIVCYLTCVCARMLSYVCVCMRVLLYVCVHACSHKYMRSGHIRVCVRVYVFMYVYVCIHTHVCMHIHTYSSMCVLANVRWQKPGGLIQASAEFEWRKMRALETKTWCE